MSAWIDPQQFDCIHHRKTSEKSIGQMLDEKIAKEGLKPEQIYIPSPKRLKKKLDQSQKIPYLEAATVIRKMTTVTRSEILELLGFKPDYKMKRELMPINYHLAKVGLELVLDDKCYMKKSGEKTYVVKNK